MSEVTAKAKSALYHLNAAQSNFEKVQVHLIQARTSLPKNAEVDRGMVEVAEEALQIFMDKVNNAKEYIFDNNPKQSD